MKSHGKSAIALKIGANILAYRQKKGITQEVLGSLTNLTTTYIGLVERGDRGTSSEVLVAIAKALGCKAADLMKGL